ncbi:MAG: hypothetical protein JW388_1069 [Nitrospira sp.]|nr:hypothetical protein [Nitrospira sp.]
MVMEVQTQDARARLRLSKMYEIDGVPKTDTHLIYRLQENTAA